MVFVLSGNFPTTKAYGVTTRETARAIEHLGHDVKVVSKLDVIRRLEKGRRIARAQAKCWEVLINSSKLSRIAFPMWQVFFAVKVRSIVSRDTEIIWSREPILALITSYLTPSKIVLEIHHVPRRFGKFLIGILRRRPRIVLSPIKVSIRESLSLNPIDSPLAEMSVNEDFLMAGKSRKSSRPLSGKIVVLGKISNAHQRASFESLLNELKLLNSTLEKTEVTFIGIEEQIGREFLSNLDLGTRIIFKSHIKHEDLPSLLCDFDLGIVPYSNDPYFRDTFPIKIVEYCAMKILVIATNTQTHKTILGENAIYYDLNKVGSLNNVLNQVWAGVLDTSSRLDRAYAWARTKTYNERVKKILQATCKLEN